MSEFIIENSHKPKASLTKFIDDNVVNLEKIINHMLIKAYQSNKMLTIYQLITVYRITFNRDY